MTSDTSNLLDGLATEGIPNQIVSLATIIQQGKLMRKLLVKEGRVLAAAGSLEVELERVALDMVEKTIESGGDTALLSLDRGEAAKLTITIEVIRPKAGLVVFGAGHVGHALAVLGALTGYEVTLVDDREAFVSRGRVPDQRIRLIAASFESAASVGISSNSAVVIVTRGHQHDEICLREVITSPARYIGMIGSKRRVIGVFQRLRNSGVDPALLERVHAPIGLDIGARSPQEIAVAILAEIIQTFNSHLIKSWGKPEPKTNRKD
ncbi:MAG: XdhC family protein [Blastocatellia bacterium]